MSVKHIVEESNTDAGRLFDAAVLVLIVSSLISFSVETLPNLSAGTRDVLTAVERVTVALFSIEYVLRLIVADRKARFVFSFFGIIDLIAILPFYLSLGVDLRSVRAFRLLRVFRILKLARYGGAVARLQRAIVIAKEELVLFFSATLIVLFLSSVGIYYFERSAQPETFASVFHGMWWALATLTTVGFGDVYPVTLGGKLFTFVVLMLGLGIVAVPTGLIASALSRAREEEAGQPDG